MLHELLKPTLDDEPDRPLLEFCDEWHTARELDEGAAILASRFRQAGVEPADRVAILLPNCPEAVKVCLACFKGGFVLVPLDYRHKAPQIQYALNHSGARVLIVHASRLSDLQTLEIMGRLPHVIVVGGEPTQPRQARFGEFLSSGFVADYEVDHEDDDICAMFFTSGTTSLPKGVTLTRRSMALGIHKYLARVGLTKEDCALVAAPITRPMALRCQLLPMLRVGGRICLIPHFTVDGFLESFRSAPPKTYLSLLPAGLSQVVAHPDFQHCDFSALRLCVCGGDRVPLYLHERFAELTGVAVSEQCGASEVGPYALNPPFGRKKPGSVGLPMYGAQVCVVDEEGSDCRANEVGEIIVQSPMMMAGYWNDTALTRKTLRRGWVHTGDLGQFDEDGYLWFMGRKKDIIIRGGSNISPHAVESHLLDFPGIAHACVIGLFDETWGQVPFAFVVGHADGDPMTESDILDFCRERLAEYEMPGAIDILEELPMKGPGKIDRDLLKVRGEIRRFIDKSSFSAEEMDRHFIEDIAPFLECKPYLRGQWICRQGEMGRSVFFLTRGRVEVIREDTGEILSTLDAGAFFGELSMLEAAPRAASIRTIEECELLELKHSDAAILSEKYPRFRAHLQGAKQQYRAH